MKIKPKLETIVKTYLSRNALTTFGPNKKVNKMAIDIIKCNRSCEVSGGKN